MREWDTVWDSPLGLTLDVGRFARGTYEDSIEVRLSWVCPTDRGQRPVLWATTLYAVEDLRAAQVALQDLLAAGDCLANDVRAELEDFALDAANARRTDEACARGDYYAMV